MLILCNFRLINSGKRYKRSQANGLLALAAARNTSLWTPAFIYWREFTLQYLNTLCHLSAHSQIPEPVMPPDQAELEQRVLALPPMPGAEYCTPAVLNNIWLDLDQWVLKEIQGFDTGLEGILLFSGSLYILSVTEIKSLGLITPIDGMAFIIAWLMLLFGILKAKL